MAKHIVFRILSGLVLLAVIAGIAFFAFNAGLARGSAELAQVPAGQMGRLPFFWHPGFFLGFGILPVLGPLFLLFLAFGAFRRMMWGPRWGRHAGGPGHMHGPWGEGVPPMFSEWHRKAHAQPAPETQEQKMV